MRFQVAIRPVEMGSDKPALCVWLFTGKQVFDSSINRDVDESFNVACEWPEKTSEQENVLQAALNELVRGAWKLDANGNVIYQERTS